MCQNCPQPGTANIRAPSVQAGGYPAPRSIFGPQNIGRVGEPSNGARFVGPPNGAGIVGQQNVPPFARHQNIPQIAGPTSALRTVGPAANPHIACPMGDPRVVGPAIGHRPVHPLGRPLNRPEGAGPWSDPNIYNPDGIADLSIAIDLLLPNQGALRSPIRGTDLNKYHAYWADPRMPGGHPSAAPSPYNNFIVQPAGSNARHGGQVVNMPGGGLSNRPRPATAPANATFVSTADKNKADDIPANLFFRLPIELRLNIYEDLLIKPYGQEVNLNSNTDSAPPAVTQVCGAMRKEALPVWMKNEFFIVIRNYDTTRGEAWHSMMEQNFRANPALRSMEMTFRWPDCENDVVGRPNLMKLLKDGWQGNSNFLDWKSKEEADAFELEKKRKAKRKGEYAGPIDEERDSDEEDEEDAEPVMRQYIRFCKLVDMMHELRKNKGLRWKDVEGTFEIAVTALALVGEPVCTDCYNG